MNKTNVITILAAAFLPLLILGVMRYSKSSKENDETLMEQITHKIEDINKELSNTEQEDEKDDEEDNNDNSSDSQLETDDTRGLGYSGQNKIVMDSQGNIYTTYRKKYDGNYEIFVSKFSTDGNNIQLIENNRPISKVGDGATQRVPSIEIDDKDNLYVVWYGLDPDNEKLGRQIKYSMSTDQGGTWTDWKNIAVVEGYEDDDYWQEHPHITFKAPNKLFVVWEGKDKDQDEQNVKFIRSMDGGKTWSEWRDLFENKDNTQSRPNIVIDSQGRLHIFYYSSKDADTQQIWHATSNNDGESWSNPVNISKSNLDARHVEAAISGNRIFAVWRAGDEENGPSNIYYSSNIDDKWSEPKKVMESSNFQFFPSIGVNKNNQAAIVWKETSEKSEYPRENPEKAEAYIAFFDNLAGGFSGKKKITSENSFYPHLIKKNPYSTKFFVVVGEGETDPIKVNILSF